VTKIILSQSVDEEKKNKPIVGIAPTSQWPIRISRPKRQGRSKLVVIDLKPKRKVKKRPVNFLAPRVKGLIPSLTVLPLFASHRLL